MGFDEAIYQKGKPFYEMLKKRLYLSPYCCVDETGWLVLAYGQGQMWTFTTDTIALYLINKSRGSEVIKLVLGEDYLGILVSDCFSSYNPVSAGAKQKCTTHIMRKNKEAEKLRGRLIKHQDELFTFLIYPCVPADNNLAERTLKPPIIHRKLMYFNTSLQGARHYEVIMTLAQTAKRNKQNVRELIRNLLIGSPPEVIIKLLLGEHTKENPSEEKGLCVPEIIPPEISPEPELALVGSGYN